MAKITTASVLIEGIKRRAAIPENQATFTTDDFLAFANEELLLGVVPAIMILHEDYFLFEILTPLVINQFEYEIPSRAVGNKLRDLQYKPDPNTYIEMTRSGIGERFGDTVNTTDTRRFYLKNNKVVINPPLANSGQGNLSFIIYIKPSDLVLEDRIGVIEAMNDLGGGQTEIVVATLPDNFTTSIKYDLYKAESPSSILSIDMTPILINTISRSVIFNTSDIPVSLKIGDHLAQAGEATIAQIPNEFHPMLEQMVACRILEAQGDTSGLQNALLKLQQMNNAGGTLIDNRVDDSPPKITNRHSLLKSNRYRRFTRRY